MCYSDAAVDKHELFDPSRFLVRDRCHKLFTMNIAFDRLQFFLEITYLLELYLMFSFLRHSLTSCTVNFIFHIKFNARLWLHLVTIAERSMHRLTQFPRKTRAYIMFL